MFARNVTRRFFSLPAVPTKFQNKMFINGEFVSAASGDTFGTYNPADESLITEVPEAGEEDVNRAVAAARHAFDHGPWRLMTGHDRSVLMHRFADLLDRDKDELAALEALDNGKHVAVAQAADINLVIRQFRSYAGWADKHFGDVVPIAGPYFQYTREEPVGVAAQIIPWNFPALMAAWKWGPALATGCVTVTKVAEQTPLSALKMAELSQEAGFPPGVINVITGQGAAGSMLAKHRDVDKVAFTGSTEVGYDVMRNSHVHNLKRVSLELGGKSANIILSDADVDLAVQQATFGLFFNAGQCCCAGSRAFVHESIYDQFVEKSVAHAASLKLGGQFSANVDQGPQIDRTQMDKILKYVESGRSDGAELLTGGNRFGDKGFYVEPTVFAGVTDDMQIAKEEIFGPVMAVMKFSTVDEVIQRANNSNYGLAAGLVTQSLDNALYVSNALRAGTIYVNCFDVFTESTSFGGYKDSGIGREVGKNGLKNYLETKNVIIKTPEGCLP